MTEEAPIPQFIEAEFEIKHPVLKAVQLLPGQENARAFAARIANSRGAIIKTLRYSVDASRLDNNITLERCELSFTMDNDEHVNIKSGQWLVFEGDGTMTVHSYGSMSHRYNLKEIK